MSTRRDPTAAAPVPAVASTVATAPPDTTAVVAQLSSVDRFLPVWIGAAMVVGLLLGRLVPGLDDALDAVKVGQTSLPIAIGLLLMMYPVLAKVRYREIGLVTADKRMIAASLLLNWVIGPAVMFALAWLLLADQPAYRTGIILVGQEQPGQGEHHRRADHPVQQQARRDHPLVRGDQADLAVAHLGEHRIHHQQQADGDRQRRLADLHRVEGVVQARDQSAEQQAGDHGGTDPHRKEPVDR